MKNHVYTFTTNGIRIILQKLLYKPKTSTVNDKSYISKRRVLTFTGFHPDIGKLCDFYLFCIEMLKKAKIIVRKTAIQQKLAEGVALAIYK